MVYKMNIKKIFLIPFLFISMVDEVLAHCPLCTAGAAVAVGGAAWLGVSKIIIGLFIGAFAVSTGLWFSRIIKKKYIPYQTLLIVVFSFIATVIPLLPIISEVYPMYISWMGGYGTLLNRTYVINGPLIGSLIGGGLVSLMPWLSSRLTKINGKTYPYQGITLTFTVLIVFAIIIQLIMI